MAEAVLLIGAEGFIGRALSYRLVSSGVRVIGGTRAPTCNLLRGVEPFIIDYDDPRGLEEALRDCRCVVHAASASTPTSTARDPAAELALNLHPLLAFLGVLADFSYIPLVYISSAGSLHSGVEDRPLLESTPPSPRSFHGAGKVAAEHFIGAHCRQYGASATIIRPSNVFGPGQEERRGFGIIPRAFGAVLRNEPITVRGDGKAARDYLYIEDLISLLTTVLMTRPPSGIDIFNAGTGVATPLDDLLRLIEDVTGQPLKCLSEPSARIDADSIAVDSAHATRLLGWAPRTSLRTGLEKTWAWFRKWHK